MGGGLGKATRRRADLLTRGDRVDHSGETRNQRDPHSESEVISLNEEAHTVGAASLIQSP